MIPELQANIDRVILENKGVDALEIYKKCKQEIAAFEQSTGQKVTGYLDYIKHIMDKLFI